MTKEMEHYFSWLQMESDLEKALRMLEEQNYGLLRSCLESLCTVARITREKAQETIRPKG